MKTYPPFKKTLLLLMLVLSSVDTGCTTKRPKPIVAHQASFDGNEQDSGVKSVSNHYYVVSGELVSRYNDLILNYGTWFIPPITTNFGVTPVVTNRAAMSKEAMSKFAIMTMWHNNRPPPKPKPNRLIQGAIWSGGAAIGLVLILLMMRALWPSRSSKQ